MRGKDFLEALGNIDNEFLEEAMNYKKKKISVKKIVAVAACVALMIGTIPLISHFNTPAGTGTTGGVIQGTTGGETELPTVIKLGESGKFTAHDMGGHSGLPTLNAIHTVEFSLNNINCFVDESKVDERKFIEINGRTWAGRYDFTTDSPYYGRDFDIYSGIDMRTWKKVFSIECDPETGEIIGFFADKCCFPDLSETPITRDEAYEKAMDFLNNTVEDMEAYTLCNESVEEYREGYRFTFNRVINGIKTDDYIAIGITGAGDIYTYHLSGYGSMGNVDLSALNMDALNKVIETKVNTIYKNNFDIMNKSDITLRRLEDGTFYFYCISRITGRTTEDGELLEDFSFFAITID